MGVEENNPSPLHQTKTSSLSLGDFSESFSLCTIQLYFSLFLTKYGNTFTHICSSVVIRTQREISIVQNETKSKVTPPFNTKKLAKKKHRKKNTGKNPAKKTRENYVLKKHGKKPAKITYSKNTGENPRKLRIQKITEKTREKTSENYIFKNAR